MEHRTKGGLLGNCQIAAAVNFSRIYFRYAALYLALIFATSAQANECSWQGHTAPVGTIINLLSGIVSPNSDADGFWKPVEIQGVTVADTGWDCDAGADVFEFPGQDPLENNVARIGNDEDGIVVIQPLTPVVLDELEISQDSGVIIADSSILLFRGSNLSNAGKIEVGSFGLLASPLRFDGTTQLTGAGQVKLVGGLAAIDGSGTLTNVDNQISGAGTISVKLINEDTITATEGMLTLTNVDQNKKELKADDGILRLTGETIDNTNGTIEGLTSGVVQLSDITIAGGTLKGSTAGSLITIGPTILDGAGKSGKGGGAITIEGFFTAQALTSIIGTINNTGSLLVPSGGDLLIDPHNGGPELVGGGTVTMSGGTISNVQPEPGPNPPGPPRLTNTDNTIEGSGDINVLFTNQGTVEANQGAAILTLNAPNADPGEEFDNAVTNEGLFTASSGGTLRLRGGHFNNSSGQVMASGGIVAVQDAAKLTGGSVQIDGAGTLLMKNSGHIADGNVNVNGALFIEAGSNRLRGDVTLNGNSNIADGATLIIGDTINDSGTSSYINNGTINIGGTSGSAGLDIAGDLSLNGGGEIILGDFLGLANRISDAQIGPGGNAVDARLTNQGQHIRGAGLIDVELTNRATIEADGTAPLTIIANGALDDSEKLVNEGTLKSSGGSTLIVKDGKIANSAGMIEAGAGSRVELSSLVVEGGNLIGDGVIDALFDVVLDGIGMTISTNLVSSGITTLIGDITNTGDIDVPNGGILQISNSGNGVSLDGGGNVNLSGGAIQFVPNEDPPGALQNVDNTIQGDGLINVALINQGTIDANTAGDLTVQAGNGANAVNNGGEMLVSGDGVLRLRIGEFNNAGGTIMASSGTLEITDGAQVTGGDLTINGGAGLRLANNIQVIDTNTTLDGDVEVASGVTNILSATVDLSGDLKISDGATLILDENGSYQSSGKITIGDFIGGGGAGLDIAGDVTLAGSGEIELARGFSLVNRISDAQIGPGGNAVAARLTNQGHRIFGAGRIDVELTNQATIEANADAPLVVIANGIADESKQLINQGTIKASSGATLQLKDGQVDNASGLISADGGSTIELSSIVVKGGTLSGDGLINALFDVTLDGIGMTIDGTFETTGATTLIGDITNSGDINVLSSGSLLISNAGAGVALDGGGNVNLDGGSIAKVAIENPAGILTNVDNTIQGSGTISAPLINQGTVDANMPGMLSIEAGTGAQALVNQGSLKASGGGTLQLRFGEVNNAGGMVTASGGDLEIRDGAFINGGNVEISGGTEARLVNNGTILGGAVVNNGGTLKVLAQGLNNRLSGVVNNNNELILDSGARLTFDSEGIYNNNGNIELDSQGGLTVLSIDGDVTISGGSILLSDNTNNRISAALGAGPSRLNLDGTSLSGAGLISVDLTNGGNISPTGAAQLSLSSSQITNTGTLGNGSGPMLINGAVIENAGGLINGAEISSTTVMGGDIGAATISGVSVFDGVDILGSVSVAPGRTLRLVNAITNQGNIALDASGPSANANLQISGTVELSGGGSVTLGDSLNNRISNVGTSRLINQDNTVSGSGLIQFLGLENHAIIAASGLSGLSIQAAGGPLGGITNTGELRADAGSTLRLNGGEVQNVGGTIRADGTVELNNNVTIIGGTLAGGGTILANSDVTLDGIGMVNSSNYEIANGRSTTLIGSFSNNGNLTLAATEPLAGFGAVTELLINGDVSLLGAGNVVMSDFSANRIASAFGQFATLTNDSNVISGSGNIGDNITGIVNRGEIRGQGAVALIIDPRDDLGFLNDTNGTLVATESGGVSLKAGDFENRGEVLVASNSTLSRDGDFLQTSGVTIVDGTLTVSDGLLIQGGTLSGSGTIVGDVFNSATTAPGNSPGTLFIDGNFEQTGVLDIEIGGSPTSGLFDAVVVSGDLSLGGLLRVSLINGFIPEVGDTYDFLQAAEILGVFSDTEIVGDAAFSSQFDLTSGRLEVTAVVPLPAGVYLLLPALSILLARSKSRMRRS